MWKPGLQACLDDISKILNALEGSQTPIESVSLEHLQRDLPVLQTTKSKKGKLHEAARELYENDGLEMYDYPHSLQPFTY